MAIEDISFKIKSNIEKIKGEVRDLDNQLKSLKNQRAELNVKAQQLNKAKSEISSINVALKKLSAQKADLKIGNEATDITKSKIKEINHAMDLLRAKKANLQITTTQLSGADTQLKKIDNEMIRLNNRKANLQVSADGMQKTIDDSNTLRGRLAQLMNKKVRINVSSNISEIGNKFQDVGRKMQKVNPLGGKLDGIVGIGAAVNLVDRAFSTVKGSMDGAISRFDTMRNFPKMMTNLGVSTEDANGAIKILDNGLQGLPTAMNDAVSSVSRFVSKNGDVKKSANQFLAVNNAILAGGTDIGKQQSALEQLTQAYSKGKFEMDEWKSVQVAMPGQLKQIAGAFGLTTSELYDAMQDGTISMDQFMDKIEELNTKGVDGFASFTDQAKAATGGLRTGLANLQNAVTRGLENMMKSVDKILTDQGFGGIAGVFEKLRVSINNTFGSISKFIESHSKEIGDAIKNIVNFFKQIDWKSFGEGLADGFKQLKSAAKGVYEVVSPIFKLLGNGNVMKGLGTAVPLIWGAGKAFVFFGGAMKLLSPVLGIFGTFIGLFSKLSKFKIPSFGGKGKGASANPVANLSEVGTSLVKNAGNLALVWGAIKVLEEAAEAMKQLDEKIPDDFSGLATKIASMSLAIGAIGGFTVIASKFNFTDSLKGLASLALVTFDLMIASEAMSQLNEKVPSNMEIVAKKIGSMTIAIGAMAGMVAIAGKFSEKQPVAAMLGLGAVALLSAELMLASEALSQLNEKVPSDMGTIAKKIGSVAIAIGAMAGLVAIAGVLTSTGIGAIIGGAGLISVALLAGERMLVSEAINQLNQKVSDDLDTVKNKLKSIEEVLSFIANSNLGKISTLFKGIVGVFSATTFNQVINNLIEVSESLRNLEKSSEKLNSDKIITSVKTINETLDVISGKDNLFQKIGKLFKGKVDTKIFDEAKKSLDELISLSNKMMTLQNNNFSVSDITSKINVLKGVLESLDPSTWGITESGVISAKVIDKADTSIYWLNKLSKKMTKLSESKLERGKVQGVIENIKGALKMLTNDSWGAFDSGIVPKSLIESIGESVDGLNSINKKLSKLTETSFDVQKTNDLIKDLKASLRMFQIKSWGDFDEGIIDRTTLDQLDTAVYWLGSIAKKFEQFTNFKFEGGKLQDTIANIKGALRLLQLKSWEDYDGGIVSKQLLDQLDTGVYWLGKVGSKLNELSSLPLERGKAQDVIENIKGSVRMLKIKSWSDFSDGFIGKEFLDKLDTSVYWLTNVGNRLTGLANINLDVKKVEDVIRDTKGALRMFQAQSWKDFNEGVVKADFIKALDIIIGNFTTLSNRTNELSGIVIDIKKVHETITSVKGVINRMTTDTFPDPTIMINEKFIDVIDTSIYRLITLANRINQIPQLNADEDTLGKKIKAIKYAATEMAISKWKGIMDGVVSPESLDKIDTCFYRLITISSRLASLNELPFDWTNVLNNVNRMKAIIELMNTFPDAKGIDSIPVLVESFKNLITTLRDLETKFEPIGKSYGEQIIKGFKNADVLTIIGKVIDDLITKLRNKESNFRDIGSRYGNALKSGFSNALNGMENNIDRILNIIGNKATAMEGIGRNYGNTFLNAFNQAISGISTSINNQISGLQSSLNTLKLPDLPSGSSNTRRARRYADGGIVQPYYFSKGGLVNFKSKGPDTVPAMLAPNEVVLPEKSARKFPRNVIFDLIRGNARGVADYFVGKEMTTINNAKNYMNHITNIIHNDNREINYSPSFAGASSPILDVNKINRNLR